MKQTEFKIMDKLADLAAEKGNSFLISTQLDDLRAAIRKAAKSLPKEYCITFDIPLNVFDLDRGQSLPLLTTGLSSAADAEPYVHSGDSTPARYLVDGEICEVPHDRCPYCWGLWDFKIGHPDASKGKTSCSDCGYVIGEQVKLLLDNDVCPHCEEDKLTMANPNCKRCGLHIDPKFVAWG